MTYGDAIVTDVMHFRILKVTSVTFEQLEDHGNNDPFYNLNIQFNTSNECSSRAKIDESEGRTKTISLGLKLADSSAARLIRAGHLKKHFPTKAPSGILPPKN